MGKRSVWPENLDVHGNMINCGQEKRRIEVVNLMLSGCCLMAKWFKFCEDGGEHLGQEGIS
jgi:hypothetical protein